MSIDWCFDQISSILPPEPSRLYLAYSGGMDSHVLLHWLASQPYLRARLVAVHVHHGLLPQADAWESHCRRTAAALCVAYRCLYVDATPGPKQSPEEAARVARYDALQTLLAPKDVMLTAHHREDQLETLLLQLFRGAGVRGLGAMAGSRPLGRGLLLRPFLDVPKQMIIRYAERHALAWITDPSNASCEYDRNFLRQEVLPLIKQRWPALDKTVARAAGHCRDADNQLNAWAERELTAFVDEHNGSLCCDGWLGYSLPQQKLLLRRWLRANGVSFPSETVLTNIVDAVIRARSDAVPEIKIGAYVVKKFQGKLSCIEARHLQTEDACYWQQGSNEIKRANHYLLRLRKANSGIAIAVWQQAEVTIRLRKGGEKIVLPGRGGRHSLKKLFQEAQIPPWLRDVMPLIYIDGQLAAVAHLWISEPFFVRHADAGCYQIDWLKN